jgi:hypothetical protein
VTPVVSEVTPVVSEITPVVSESSEEVINLNPGQVYYSVETRNNSEKAAGEGE